MKIGAETKKDRIIGLPEMIIMITTIAIPIHRRFKLLRQRASKLRKAKTDQPTNERTSDWKRKKDFFSYFQPFEVVRVKLVPFIILPEILKNGPNPASFCLFLFFSHIAWTNIAQIWL